MSIIVIESIGFCATHTISDCLRMDGQNYVSHGTKNFKKLTLMGDSNLSFHQFHSQMIELQKQYLHCISVHSNFSPIDIAKEITETDTKFFALMRKSQRNQILSCFYWSINEFLNGRESFTNILSNINQKYSSIFKQISLPNNMITCFLLYAYRHVCLFNIMLAENAQKVFFMEDIIDDPVKFALDIGATGIKDVSLKVERGPSHKSKVKEYKFLTNLDEILEVMNENLRLDYANQTFNIDSIENFCLNKS